MGERGKHDCKGVESIALFPSMEGSFCELIGLLSEIVGMCVPVSSNRSGNKQEGGSPFAEVITFPTRTLRSQLDFLFQMGT